MERQFDIEPLLGHLYDAVLAPQGFAPFIETLCRVFDLKGVILCIRQMDTQEMKGLWVHGVADEWMERYALEYAHEDILAHHIARSPIGCFYASNLDMPSPENFPQNRFYREWVAPQGMAYAAGSVVLREGSWDTQLFLQRGPGHGPFTRDEVRLFDTLVPHIQRALQIRQRLADFRLEHDLLASGLDLLGMATFLIDDTSRVAHVNQRARALLAQQDGLRQSGAHLVATDPFANRQMNYALTEAIHHKGDRASNVVVLLPRLIRLPLMLMVAALRLSSRRATLLFAFDPDDARKITADTIQRLFGLTNAEAALAVALCSGMNLDRAAQARGTTVHTCRSQLKSIFAKTGTNRQADLISLLLASPAYFVATG